MTSTTVAVIDYGMGNLFSVCSALQRAAPEARVVVADTPAAISAADRIIFPGQGAIKGAMEAIEQHNLLDALQCAAREKPFFGMCLGPQAMLSHSTENGGVDALNIIPGNSQHFREIAQQLSGEHSIKIPHMGWNQVSQNQHALWDGINDNSWFYFVHSYYMVPERSEHIMGHVEYGMPVCAAIGHENCFGVQFHPEKSAEAGLRLLHNVCHWQP